MKKEINLHFSSTQRGPGRVVESLARGLAGIGWSVYGNSRIQSDVIQGCLQPTQALGSLPRNAIMGPNLFIFPSEWGEICKKFDHYVVPSEWVKKKYQKYAEMSSSTIDVWPAGIDTDLWSPKNQQKKEVLVYFKSRQREELDFVINHLRSRSVPHRIIEYGKYEEKDLYLACESARSCILLTGTESQGIAYMQILSMGVPCYVVNKSKFDYFHYKDNPADSTSVPYFDQRCGEIFDTFNIDRFDEFSQKISSFLPREFIEESFTLEQAAKKYENIILGYI